MTRGSDDMGDWRHRNAVVRLGALGGYQRVWRAVLELENSLATGYWSDVFTDGNDTTAVQTETWSVAQIEALQGLPRERLVIGLAVQKCKRSELRVSDTERPSRSARTRRAFAITASALKSGASAASKKPSRTTGDKSWASGIRSKTTAKPR